MKIENKKIAIIAGMGEGLGLSLAKKLLAESYYVVGLSRSAKSQTELGEHYLAIACDITDQKSHKNALVEIEKISGNVSVYIHNAAYLIQKPFLETSKDDFMKLWGVCCLSAMQGIQSILPTMLDRHDKKGKGTILVTGATASIKAGSQFSAFSSAKFALRGLTQSLAREFSPQGIHIAHIIIDGAVWGWQAEHKFARKQHDCLQAEAIAESYYHLIQQHRSAWTHELDLRPDIEVF